MAEVMNLYQKINEIRKRVGYVKKDREIAAKNRTYKAVSHDQVTATTRQHFIDVGILIFPSVRERKVSYVTTKTGATAVMYEGIFDIEFRDVETSGYHTITVDAHAWDYGDKAAGAALSYAVKGAILKVLSLETGENDEARNVTIDEVVGKKEAVITEGQFKELWELAENQPEVWPHPKAAMDEIAKRAGLRTVDEVAAAEFERVREWMKRKIEKKSGSQEKA